MNNIETMKQWLEELNDLAAWNDGEVGGHMDEPYAAEVARRIIKSLSQAIEQAQQAEPDYYGLTKDHLWMSITKDHHDRLKPEFRMACYTSPPPRQPLTDEELRVIENKINPNMRWRSSDEEGITLYPQEYYELVRAIEAAHNIKEKNT